MPTIIKSEDGASYDVTPFEEFDKPRVRTKDEEDFLIWEALMLLQKRVKHSHYLTSPDEVRNYLVMKYSGEEREIFGMLLLNNQHMIVSWHELFFGTIDGASVYPREVLKLVLKHNAAAVVMFHNHPSGVPTASAADRTLTSKLVAALKLIDVRTLDHVIIGAADVKPFSFAENGLI